MSPQAPPKSVPADLSKALSSERFARVIDALHQAESKELMYLKLQEWSGRTARMLGLDDSKLQLGYAGKATNAVDRINKPLVGSVYQGIAKEEVSEYGESLSALPRVRKDQDYLETANAILRATETRKRVSEEFPGFEESWTQLFDEDLNPVIQGLPNLISDPDRRQLFEALAATVSGEVPPELEQVRKEIEATHEAFLEGNTETVGDGLFGITSMLTQTPPPQPPGEGDPDPDGDDEEDESDGDESNSKSGSNDKQDGSKKKNKQGASGSDEDESEDDESEDDESEQDESEDESGDDEEQGESGGDDGEDEDPFEQLGKFAKNESDDDYDPDQVGAESKFDPPPDPDDIDMDALAELDRLKADVGLPKVHDTGAYLYFVVPRPANAKVVWNKTLKLYRNENDQVRRIIDEHYRTAMIVERGLRSGRVDGSRLHRFRSAHSQEVFRRDVMDSIGHVDLVVLIDESGSMTAIDGVDGFREPPSELTHRANRRGYGGDAGLLLGETTEALGRARSDTARLMAMFLLDASRHLPGFNVRVAGYTDSSVPEGSALASVANAVKKANSAGGESPFHYHHFSPIVRLLGTQENPYPVTASAPFAGNADAQALSYALDHLKSSDAPQKAVLYLADGHVYDGEEHMTTMFNKLERMGAYPFFMNLAGSSGHYESGPLSRIDRQDVKSFKDMLDGLKTFLHNLVRQLG